MAETLLRFDSSPCDEEKFVQAIKPSFNIIRSIAYRYGVSADDVLQETLLRVWVRRSEFEGNARGFSSWVCRFAHYVAKEQRGETARHRQERLLQEAADLDFDEEMLGSLQILAMEDSPDQLCMKHDDVTALLEAMKCLNESQRRLLLDYFGSKPSLRQLASEWGLSHVKMGKMIQAAKSVLRDVLSGLN